MTRRCCCVDTAPSTTMQGTFSFDPASLDPAKRRDGISALLLVKNGEEFLDLTLRTRIDFVDEVIAVPNGCTDRSLEILQKAQNDYPGKIKIYEYAPTVYPTRTKLHAETPADSLNSFCNLCNWGMSKTTYKIFTRMDDDDISIETQVERITAFVRTKMKFNQFVPAYGIQMVHTHEQKVRLAVAAPRFFCGGNDHRYMHIHPERIFRHTPRTALLEPPGLSWRYCRRGPVQYMHVDHCKERFIAKYFHADDPDINSDLGILTAQPAVINFVKRLRYVPLERLLGFRHLQLLPVLQAYGMRVSLRRLSGHAMDARAQRSCLVTADLIAKHIRSTLSHQRYRYPALRQVNRRRYVGQLALAGLVYYAHRYVVIYRIIRIPLKISRVLRQLGQFFRRKRDWPRKTGLQ